MINDNPRSLAIRAVSAIFLILSCIAVILRCYVRFWVVRSFGWDDATMALSMLCFCILAGCFIGGSLSGIGQHMADLTPLETEQGMKYWWISQLGYSFCSIFCKISVCIFLLRIAVKPVHVWILRVVMVLTLMAGLAFWLLVMLQCRPVSYFWRRYSDPNYRGKCSSVNAFIAMVYIYSVFAALCDFTVGILPIFLVKDLHMKRQTKLAVMGILSIACIASCAVIIRIPWVQYYGQSDFLYANIEVAIWSVIEAGLGIIAGSLATLRPLVRKWFGTHGDSDYSMQLPVRSSSRRDISGNKRMRYALHSVDNDVERNLRPGPIAVTVTTIKGQEHTEEDWSSRVDLNSSEEQLTATKPSKDLYNGSGMGLSIHRTVEVTQTVSDTNEASTSEREHV